jgi:hypothetical protein
MLRIGFLPSDFNPMLLLLAEADDLRALGGALRRFARDGVPLRLDSLSCCAAGRTRVELRADAGAPGLHALAGAADSFVWRLDAATARTCAAQLDDLAAPSRVAGSEMLDDAGAGAIPVKVSRGEYTDDFLRG